MTKALNSIIQRQSQIANLRGRSTNVFWTFLYQVYNLLIQKRLIEIEVFKLTSLHHFRELTLIQIGASFDSYFKT